MVTVKDKSISIDEAVQLIEESNAAHIYITGKKFDAPIHYENQTPKSAIALIKDTFDARTYFRHNMSGKYLVERDDSGQVMHKINLYFQSKESEINFIEFEIKYIPVVVNEYDILLDDNPVTAPTASYLNQSERIFLQDYATLPSKLEKAANAPMRRPVKKKGTFYFLKALYNYVMGNDF